jgi:hypothetical protein
MSALKVILDENGVQVTNKALTTPKGTFEFSRIKNIKLTSWKTGFPFQRVETFRLVVDNFEAEIIAIETKDAEFIQRVQRAMNQAASSR